jgi:dolichyl-phosphate beta-glucosyltransferase
MLLSIVIPAYNEEKRLGASLQEIQTFLPNHFEQTEVIVVNDGSSDRTGQVVSSFVKQGGAHRIACIELAQNSGKGAAVKAGVEHATGDYILFMDADLSTPLTEISKVLAPLQNGKDVAVGSRAIKSSNILERQPFYRESMGKLFNLFVRLLVINGISDTQCGFKAFRREAAKEIFNRLETTRFGFDVEVLVWAKVLGYSVEEVGVTWVNSPHSRVSPIRDSLEMLWSLFQIRRRVYGVFKQSQKNRNLNVKYGEGSLR